jgi:membrane fusion protein, multidrug efflux system
MSIGKRIIFLTVFAAAFLSCHSKKNSVAPRQAPQGPLVVEGFIVEPQNLRNFLDVPGSLLPAEETQIRSEVSGRVVQLNIQEGAHVKKGALLVKLFDQDLRAQLSKIQVQLQIAEKTEDRQRELLAINGISQQDYDLSALQVENLKADIESLKIAISKTELRAPYDGLMGLRNVSLGAYLSPNEVVTTLRKVDELKLEFSIPEKYAKDVARGMKVRFRVDGGVQDHYASVIATESGVDQTTRTLRVRALVTERSRELVPGIFARVNLILGADNNALMVPTQAVIPQARNKQVILYKRDTAKFTVVETGMRDSVYVQVTQGLKAGDTVITTGLMAIRPNARIKIGRIKRYQQTNL